MNPCPICDAPLLTQPCSSCGYSDNPTPSGSLMAGTRLRDGRYTIERFLAQGGMGSIYQAVDNRLKRPCILKEMLDDGSAAEKPQRIAQFRKEAEILAGLHHSHVVELWDYFEEQDRYFLVEEFLEGGDLDGLDKPLSEPRVVEIAVQIAQALAYLHNENIVYRDLKPANVLLRRNGEAVLADFGIARIFDERKKGNTTVFVSKGYAPPEQYRSEIQTTPASDVYALAATLHELLTGRTPLSWQAGNDLLIRLPPLRGERPDVSPGLADLIDRCLNFKIDARLPNGTAVLQQLGPLRQRWANAKCSCGHQNELGAIACTNCQRPLTRVVAVDAISPGPFAWRVRPPFQQAWRSPLREQTRGTLLLESGRLRVATENGNLHELDLAGKGVRTVRLGAPSRSTPVPYAHGTLIGTKGGLAIEGAWLHRGDEIFAPPLIQPEGVYVITYSGQVLALNHQGKLRWKVALRGDGIHPVQEVGDDLLATTKDGIVRRLRRDGSTRWEIALGERLYGHPIVTSRQILALDAKGSLRLLDRETGAQHVQILILDGAYASPSFNADGWVLVSQSGVVVRLDSSLQEVWRHDLDSSVVAPPCLAGPWAVIGDRKGKLHILRLSDGHPEASLTTGSEWIAPPIADGNALFGVTYDGTVHCYIGQEG